MSQSRRHRPRRFWFWIALGLSVVVGISGFCMTWIATYYESWDHFTFGDNSLGLTFVVHVRASGPLTSDKDVTIGNLQVLAYTAMNISRITLLVRGENARYEIECTKDVIYIERKSYNEFWDISCCNGRVIFDQSGIQNMSVRVRTQPGEIQTLKPSEDGQVYVLPKEVDDNWNSGRILTSTAVMGIALVAIPSAMKIFRDLYRDK